MKNLQQHFQTRHVKSACELYFWIHATKCIHLMFESIKINSHFMFIRYLMCCNFNILHLNTLGICLCFLYFVHITKSKLHGTWQWHDGHSSVYKVCDYSAQCTWHIPQFGIRRWIHPNDIISYTLLLYGLLIFSNALIFPFK